MAESALANAILLAHPFLSVKIALTTDTSDVAVGAVLEQKVSGGSRLPFSVVRLGTASANTVFLTGGCWPYTWRCNILVFSLRVVALLCMLITSP